MRIHGRGGQGVVSGAEILSIAAFLQGLHAQAFPSFGSERMGAPVMAFCRMDAKPIRTREPVMRPDALIIQDATLLHQVDLFSGVPRSAHILINSTRTFDELGIGEFVRDFRRGRLVTVAASEIALKHIGRPLPNAALIGGFAATTSQLSLDCVIAAIRQKFSGKVAEANVAATTAAYRELSAHKGAVHA